VVLTIVGATASLVSSSKTNPDAPAISKDGPTIETLATCGLSGTSTRTLSVGGITREYKVIVPQGISFPASVVFIYHGISSDTATIEGKIKAAAYQQTASVKSLLVYPEAKNKGGNGLFDPAAFNGAACCKNAVDFNDEETFEAIVNALTAEGCVNSQKVNVMGFSNGGFMVHRLACASRTKAKVTAACAHSGLIGDYTGDLSKSPWKTCDSKSIMGIHGTSDTTVPFNGGKNPLGPSRWNSFDVTMGIWEAQCGAPSEITQGSKTTRTSKCGSHEVVAIKHAGFAHDWHSDSTADCFSFFSANGGI